MLAVVVVPSVGGVGAIMISEWIRLKRQLAVSLLYMRATLHPIPCSEPCGSIYCGCYLYLVVVLPSLDWYDPSLLLKPLKSFGWAAVKLHTHNVFYRRTSTEAAFSPTIQPADQHEQASGASGM